MSTAPLRHVVCVTHLGLLRELRCHIEYSASSSLITLEFITVTQCVFGITHSPFGHFDLGNPWLTLLIGMWIVGCAFVSLSPVLRHVMRVELIHLLHVGFVQHSPHQGSQANFPRLGPKRNSKLTFNKTISSSYPLIIAVQSRPIAFRRLAASLSCYVPVPAFAFRLDRMIPALSYGVVPYATFNNALSRRTPT